MGVMPIYYRCPKPFVGHEADIVAYIFNSVLLFFESRHSRAYFARNTFPPMIISEFYEDHGFGNMLWWYFVTRVAAHKQGLPFGFLGAERFRGRGFLNLDMGKEVTGGSGSGMGIPGLLPLGLTNYFKEGRLLHPDGSDISGADPLLMQQPDGTKLDGYMQAVDYLQGYRPLILQWAGPLAVYDMPPDVCVMHLRGGDYKSTEAVLGAAYYRAAMQHMEARFGVKSFVMVTDDVEYARSLLPEVPLAGSAVSGIRDEVQGSNHIGGPIAADFLLLASARNIITSASTFSWWAAFLNQNIPNVVAPKYWFAHNRSNGYWSPGDSISEGWHYLHQNRLFSSAECRTELNLYKGKYPYLYRLHRSKSKIVMKTIKIFNSLRYKMNL